MGDDSDGSTSRRPRYPSHVPAGDIRIDAGCNGEEGEI